MGIGDGECGCAATWRGRGNPVHAVARGGTPLLRVQGLEDAGGGPAEAVELGLRLGRDLVVQADPQRRLWGTGGVVRRVGAVDPAVAVVEAVGDVAAAVDVVRLVLGLARAQEAVEQGDAGAVVAVFQQCPGRDGGLLAGFDAVRIRCVGRGALVPTGVPHGRGAAEGVVVDVGGAVVGVDDLHREGAQAAVGGGGRELLGIGGLDNGRLGAARRGVRRRGLSVVDVLDRGHPPVLVVRGGSGRQVVRGTAVIAVQGFGRGDVVLARLRRGPQRSTVVGRPGLAGDGRRSGVRRAERAAGLDGLRVGDEPVDGVRRDVSGAGALLVTGDADVTFVGDSPGLTVVVESAAGADRPGRAAVRLERLDGHALGADHPGGHRGKSSSLGSVGFARRGRGGLAVLAGQRLHRPARGATDPGVVHRAGEGLAAVLVVLVKIDGFADEASELIAVLDALEGADGPRLPVGEGVAVHAAEVDRLGQTLSGGTDPGTDPLVAAEVVPGALLVRGELGVVAPPSNTVEVLVVGDLVRRSRAGHQVVLGDRVHEVLVEPVEDRVDRAFRGPPGRVAAPGVAVRGGQGTGDAVDAGVLDVGVGTGLGGDPVDPEPVQR